MNPIYFKVLQLQVDPSRDLTSSEAIGTGIYIGVLFLIGIAVAVYFMKKMRK